MSNRTVAPNPYTVGMLRILIWVGVGVIALLMLWGLARGMKRVFLLDNPRFTLRHIDVRVNGQLRPADIILKLARRGVKVEQTNLFAIDLKRQRAALCAYVMVAEADLHLKLPDTLVVEVTERVPVARLVGRSGRFIDADGWLLPPRDQTQALALPVIFGVREGRGLQDGAKVTDEMVTGALSFLRLISIRPYGRSLDVAAIQLDYGRAALRVHLRPRGTFKTGAQILLPSRPMELEEALQRVDSIVRERTRANQGTGFIDATYRVNVPILPPQEPVPLGATN